MQGLVGTPHHVPAVVRDVEVTAPLPSVAAVREDGTRIAQAWLLARYHTEPLGLLRLDLPPAGLTPADVERSVDREFGASIAARKAAPTYLSGRAEALAAAPGITVVICTRGRAESLRRTLDSLRSQRYPSVRILVVDNAPIDDSTSRAARAAAVDYLRVPAPGLSKARNAAVREASGETVAWIDDDEIVDEYWLGEIARALREQPTADVICGSIIAAELETDAQLWFEQFGGLVKGRGFTPAVFSPETRDTHHPLLPLPPFGAGANMVTRPGVVERVGGFDPALGAGTAAMGGEDTLFFTELLRAGGTIAYRPSILARHFHRRELEGLRRQLIGYGTGLTAAYAALARRNPAVLPGLLLLLPRAGRALLSRHSQRFATIGPDFPPELLRANRRAMLRGPIAYLRGAL